MDQGWAFAMNNLGWSAGVALGAGVGGALGQLVGDGLPYALCAALLLVTAAAAPRIVPVRAPDAGRRAASATACSVRHVIVAELELDLEVFTGPFDLLLTLVLREEVDLLEVQLADVVVSYLDVLEARGELDLEVATEFLVLIAALLELKSRLMLPRADEDLLDELDAGEAADELLARMLDARRYRRAAEHLADRLDDERGHRFRLAPPPAFLRRVTYEASGQVYEPAQLGSAIGGHAAHAAAGRPRAPGDPARERVRAPRAPAPAAAQRRRLVRRAPSPAPTG